MELTSSSVAVAKKHARSKTIVMANEAGYDERDIKTLTRNSMPMPFPAEVVQQTWKTRRERYTRSTRPYYGY